MYVITMLYFCVNTVGEIGLAITPKVAVKYPLGNKEVEGSNPTAAEMKIGQLVSPLHFWAPRDPQDMKGPGRPVNIKAEQCLYRVPTPQGKQGK